jgi:hypothetical protein
MLVSVEEPDHIVAGNGRQQGLSIGFAPPVWRTGSSVIEGAPFRIPMFRREGVPTVVLEQQDRAAVSGGRRKIVLEPG